MTVKKPGRKACSLQLGSILYTQGRDEGSYIQTIRRGEVCWETGPLSAPLYAPPPPDSTLFLLSTNTTHSLPMTNAIQGSSCLFMQPKLRFLGNILSSPPDLAVVPPGVADIKQEQSK